MKVCSKCKQTLDITEFAYVNRTTGKLHCQCNVCRRETAKDSYIKHKKSVISKVIARNKRKREWYQSIKQGLSCCVCKESDPVCLDFHHIDPDDKAEELSNAYKLGRQVIIDEMNKCACLCSNCHRKYHAGRLNVQLVKLEIV